MNKNDKINFWVTDIEYDLSDWKEYVPKPDEMTEETLLESLPKEVKIEKEDFLSWFKCGEKWDEFEDEEDFKESVNNRIFTILESEFGWCLNNISYELETEQYGTISC